MSFMSIVFARNSYNFFQSPACTYSSFSKCIETWQVFFLILINTSKITSKHFFDPRLKKTEKLCHFLSGPEKGIAWYTGSRAKKSTNSFEF